LQIKELKEESRKTIYELEYRLNEKALQIKTLQIELQQMPPINLASIHDEIKKAQQSIQIEQE